jgi:NitT/TauT family transport system substrate-binding protein
MDQPDPTRPPGHGRPCRPIRRRRPWAALAAGLAFLLAGCGGAATSAGEGAGEGGTTPVTFLNVVPIESLTFTPEIIAQAGGHFAAEGLDVEFQVTRGSAQAIQTVIAGSAELTRISDSELMVATGERNAPITAVGHPSRQSTLRIVSAAGNPVRGPEDLRGKTIGIPSEGGASETMVDVLAASGGIPEAELSKQVVGLAPGVFQLVKQGRIDAYLVTMDTAVTLEQQEPDAVVLDPSQVISGGTQLYITNKAALDDEAQRDTAQRYMRAIRAAMEQVIADKSLDKTLEMLGSEYDIPILRQPEVAKESLRSYIASWQAGGGPLLETSPETWTDIYEESVSVGLVPDGLDPGAWFTNDILVGAAS